MHPILFEFGLLKIYSYGLMVTCAFIISTSLLRLEAIRQGFDSEKILNLSIWIVFSGVLGARLLYILQNLNFYLKHPVEMIMLHKGGLSFYGGFGLALICAIIFLKKGHLPMREIFDLVSPYLALAQAIGRIGCFFNGCCYGRPTDPFFRVNFAGENFGRHPVQLYSSLSLLFIFIVLRIFQVKQKEKTEASGQVFLLYCLLYSLKRFFMEYLRGDNLRIFARFTIAQLISLGIFVIAGGLLWRRQKNSTSKLAQ